MDFQQLVDSMAAMTCVMSVEKRDDGYGEIRIVTGNRSYIDSIEKPAEGAEMLTSTFVPNSLYTNYFTQDLNFEDFCYRSAVHKKCLHSYVHPERVPVWFNLTFLPVNADDGNLCYCTYTMEIDMQPSSERMSNISGDLASSVLETSIKLRVASDFRAAMSDVIGDIRELCSAEYCGILLMDDYERSCTVLCEDIAEGSDLLSMEAYMNDDFYDLAESWEGTIAGSNCLIAKNEHDMNVVKERNPLWYQSLKNARVERIVLFPLKTRGGLLGYIWAVNFNPENAGKIKETLEVTTYILASEIANYLLLDRLKVLSSRDMLTGVLNRNEMNNVVEDLGNGTLGRGKSVGIAFADLNGLKEVNDTGGHNAGDALLKDAARALCEVFDADQVFRAGGDEFTIIAVGVTESELLEKVADVKEVAKRYDNVSFAVGTSFDADSMNVREALRIADERMYEDKRAYYLANPEKKHRTTKSEHRHQAPNE